MELAADAWDARATTYRAAYARWRQAEALLAGKGGRAAASSVLRDAHAIAVGLGARPLAEAIEALGRRSRIDLLSTRPAPTAPPERDDAVGLIQREREVLDQLALGRTNRQISEELFISVKTAGVHGSHILENLDVDTRGGRSRRAPARARRVGCGRVSRRAIVTGAASGIGRAIAQALADDGAQVLAVDLEPDPAGPGEPFAADLTTRDGNRAAVERAVEAFGGLDTIVANAGFQHVAPVAEFDEDRWDALLALLVTSPFLLARYGWEALAASGQGRFVAIASAHGLVASPFKAGYVAAKHGVLGLVKTLALEGAEQGISATAICPGFVRTPLVEGQIADQAQAHGISEDEVLEQVILAPHVLKRLIEPDEVAAAVLFLLGPSGSAFTGAPFVMDAGWTAR